MSNHTRLGALLLALLSVVAVRAAGADGLMAAVGSPGNMATQQTAYTPDNGLGAPAPVAAIGSAHTLIFSAAPRESKQISEAMYGPIAAYLSQVLGKKVEYKYPGTWGYYESEMLKGAYDIEFDGPHFNSYRAEKLGYHVVAKIPKKHEFVIIIKKDDAKYHDLADLDGRTFCSNSPPNLGALVLLAQYTNPSRQPVIVSTRGWKNIYSGVMSGNCVGGILPLRNLHLYDPGGVNARILYTSPVMPNQAFSVGPRVSPEDQKKIEAALTSPQAASATAMVRAAYNVGPGFVPANNAEYAGIAEYLKNQWGFYQ